MIYLLLFCNCDTWCRNRKIKIEHNKPRVMAENLEKIRPVLTALEIGDEVTFPISRLKSVRTQASELGAIFNRLFKTRTDRENQTITVKRVK